MRASLLFVLAVITVPLVLAVVACAAHERAAAPGDVVAAPVHISETLPAPAVSNAPVPARAVVDKPGLQRRIDALVAAAPITFLPNSATLTPSGVATVDHVADLLRNVAGILVEVNGHVARTPGHELDPQLLSDQRAAAVRIELVRLGIAVSRIKAQGFSDSRPIAPSDTEAGLAANRRVEIAVR